MTLNKIFLDELGNMLHVENLLIKALPKFAQAAEAPQLASIFRDHFTETQGHVVRLHKVFTRFKIPAREKKCDAMMGVLLQAKQYSERSKPCPGLDSALVCIARKIEAWETISYKSLASWAVLLDDKPSASLFTDNLLEEENTAKLLGKIVFSCDVRAGNAAEEAAVAR